MHKERCFRVKSWSGVEEEEVVEEEEGREEEEEEEAVAAARLMPSAIKSTADAYNPLLESLSSISPYRPEFCSNHDKTMTRSSPPCAPPRAGGSTRDKSSSALLEKN